MPGDRRAPVVADDDGLRRARARRARRPCRRRDETACTDRWLPAGLSGHSRACRARRRDSRPPRAPSADGATNTRIPESRGRGARRGRFPPRRDGSRIPFASTVRWAISVTRLLLRFGIDLHAFDDDSNMRASFASGARSDVTAAFATVDVLNQDRFPHSLSAHLAEFALRFARFRRPQHVMTLTKLC